MATKMIVLVPISHTKIKATICFKSYLLKAKSSLPIFKQINGLTQKVS